MIVPPPVLVRNALGAWGADGRRWLDDLPRTAAAVARDWDLRVGEPFALSYHWVAEATTNDGAPAVLKLGPTGPGHLAHEAAALGIFGGRGAVRLLAHDAERGALLLERATPGTLARDLVPHRDEEATAAVVEVIRRLHRKPPPDCALPDLAETEGASFAGHLDRFHGDDPLPRHLVERAAGLLAELSADGERVVLHGDLHHDNVLRAEREPWLAIDPHGYVGDPGYDTGALLYNPDPGDRGAEKLRLLPARIEQLADGLGMPRERVEAWGFVVSVLSEVWTTEDGGAPDGGPLAVAFHLLPRLT
ncbi:aminoglycoside phosphotransferase family protein [Actinomadura decatromicini]|uniref:Phosphotransferase n=1 Tax=Actinomadura decatromicini TaxID=2604572 RepID=A0A5D3FCI1_9ACTN|nr:aminoglycoside phosphotransferase family protein [Actinomadura decatromicini]TYK46021.1 phosphotransferase [Actinomadura decatromicini]